MNGRTDSASDTAERLPNLRPRDSASLILIDRSGRKPLCLLGKRGKAHVFMPELYVFPGGARDAADSQIGVAGRLDASVTEKLLLSAGHRMSAARARALAVAAIRETYEEAGMRIGAAGDVGRHPDWLAFAEDNIAPDLSRLRFVARAITPPRQKRRFDARFFACFLDEVSASREDACDSCELHDLAWIAFDEMDDWPMPGITRRVLHDLKAELSNDPALPFGRPVPFYFSRYGRRERVML